MPNVYTPFNPRERDSIPRVSVGSALEVEYSEYVDGFGAHKLAARGTFDRVQYVNAQKDMANLKLMIERYSLGDTNALNRASCFYADTTQMPTSLQEWSSLKKNITKLFGELPKNVRKKYGTPEQFVAAYGTDGFNEALGIVPKSVQPTEAPAAGASATVSTAAVPTDIHTPEVTK